MEIELLGSAVLCRVAEPAPEDDPELADLVTRMLETMYAAGGQGLAAPQVGRGYRLAVARYRKGRRDDRIRTGPVSTTRP